MAQREVFEKAKNLYGQVSGTRKCIELIKNGGVEIPQEMIDIFVAQEKEHEAEVARLNVGELPETDLTLSPLVLPLIFVNKEALASLDPYGSNIDLIGSETASLLQTSNNSVTDNPVL